MPKCTSIRIMLYYNALEYIQYSRALDYWNIAHNALESMQYCSALKCMQYCNALEYMQYCNALKCVQYCNALEYMQYCNALDHMQYCIHCFIITNNMHAIIANAAS